MIELPTLLLANKFIINHNIFKIFAFKISFEYTYKFKHPFNVLEFRVENQKFGI